MERRELGAMVEPLGRRAEAESRTQRLEAKTRDPPAMTPMETGRPAVNPAHRWWAGMTGGGRRGRVGGYLGCSGCLESVCAAHIHHKTTFSTVSASVRGTISMVIIVLAYDSGQPNISRQTYRQFRAGR